MVSGYILPTAKYKPNAADGIRLHSTDSEIAEIFYFDLTNSYTHNIIECLEVLTGLKPSLDDMASSTRLKPSLDDMASSTPLNV